MNGMYGMCGMSGMSRMDHETMRHEKQYLKQRDQPNEIKGRCITLICTVSHRYLTRQQEISQLSP